MIKTIETLDEVMNFALELSNDDFYASYPRMKAISEIKEEIEKSIISEVANVIACYKEGLLCGVCAYYWDLDDKYAQTTQFLIKEFYDETAEEIISYIKGEFIRNELKGYELLIGVPVTNKNANNYFVKNNIECSESSVDTRLYNLNINSKQKHNCIEKITEDTFDEYAIFHDNYAIPSGMYYNSKNLKKDMKEFQILAFVKDGSIHGSIFTKAFKDMAEVFGVFIDEEHKKKGIEGMLINDMLIHLYNEFGSVNEILYFINEGCDEELKAALDSGFEINDNYKSYKLSL